MLASPPLPISRIIVHNFFLCFCPLLFHTLNPKSTTAFSYPLPHHARSELFSAPIDQATLTRRKQISCPTLRFPSSGCALFPRPAPLSSSLFRNTVLRSPRNQATRLDRIDNPGKPPTFRHIDKRPSLNPSGEALCGYITDWAFPICSQECGEVVDTSPDGLSLGFSAD